MGRKAELNFKTKKLPAVIKSNRQIKTRVFVVAEGMTEEEYLKRLNNLGIFPKHSFVFKKGKEDNYLLLKKQNLENQHFYLWLDMDNLSPNSKDRGQKINKLYQNKAYRPYIFFNNPSFETFLLNHFINLTKPITTKKEYDELFKKHLGIESWSNNKTKKNICKVMGKISKERFEKGLVNVRSIYKENPFVNPNSNMHLMFEKFPKE